MKKIISVFLVIVLNTSLVVGQVSKTPIKISSPDFRNNKLIPVKFTCDGENISPNLKWTFYPYRTQSFAIICDDPDAPNGDWVHWVVYNIPLVLELKENLSSLEKFPSGITHGKNSWGKIGYGGPCPPSGTHRYFFKIYALDKMLNLEPGLTKYELLDAIKEHIIAKGELIGKYKRK